MARRLEYMLLDELVPADRNPKDHAGAVIKASITRFGFLEIPVLDERTGKLVAGHGRRDDLLERRAAGEAPPDGITLDGRKRWKVPVIRGWSSSSDDEAHAAGIAINRATELGGWKMLELTQMLDEFRGGEVSLEGLGFDDRELDVMIAQLAAEPQEKEPAPAREVIGLPTNPVTKRGDVWLLGRHRLLCGDCRDLDDVRRLAGELRVNVAFTSPPYAEQRDYDEASGFVPIPPDEYVQWFAAVAGNVAEVLADDGSWFVNIKPASKDLDTDLYVLDLVLAHAREWGWHFVTEFCWERTGVPKRVANRFKNQFEPIYHFARGTFKMRPDQVRHLTDNAIAPMEPGASAGTNMRLRHHQGGTGTGPIAPREVDPNSGSMAKAQGVPGGPNVGKRRARSKGTINHNGGQELAQGTSWAPGSSGFTEYGLAYPGNRLPTFSSSHEATGHAAAFPVGLPAWFAKAYSDAGDVLFDPFVGSGSTILAAELEGRVGLGVELSPAYCDVICSRFERHTGQTATLEATGKPFKARRTKP